MYRSSSRGFSSTGRMRAARAFPSSASRRKRLRRALTAANSAATYNANLAKFNSRLDARLVEWQKQLAPYSGAKIVTYHRDFVYLAQRFGLTIVDELEPKPGIAPSPAHLAQVIGKMKANNVRIILVQPFQNRKTAETVARQTGATVIDAPQQPGAASNTASWFDNMDNLVRAISNALGAQK